MNQGVPSKDADVVSWEEVLCPVPFRADDGSAHATREMLVRRMLLACVCHSGICMYVCMYVCDVCDVCMYVYAYMYVCLCKKYGV